MPRNPTRPSPELDTVDSTRSSSSSAHAFLADAAWDWDIPHKQVVWIDAGTRLFDTDDGATPAGPGRPPVGVEWWHSRVHPEDRRRVIRGIVSAVRGSDDTWSDEYRFRRPDGSYSTVLARGFILRDAHGHALRMSGSIIDISKQKREEQRQRLLADVGHLLSSSLDHRARLSSLATLIVPELADCCIIDLVEESGEVQRLEVVHADAGRAGLARRLLDFPPSAREQEGPGRALRSGAPVLLPILTDADLADHALDAAHLELLRALEVRSIMIVPLVAHDRVLGLVTLVRTDELHRYTEADLQLIEDVTDRAALAIDNARLYASAQQANKAKTEFLSMISHEFRTPLSAIMGYTDLLGTEYSGPLTLEQKEQLDRIRTSAWHLLHLIEEILTFLRSETGRSEVHLRRVDVTDIVRQAVAVTEPMARDRSIGLLVQTARCEIETDPGKLRQILVNLLTNAVKYTDRGEIRLELGIGTDWIEFRVHDTGIGIAPAHIDQIFDPFWQVDQSATRRSSGTGLGLSVVQRLSRLLGGDVAVDSELGVGSRFTVRLPAGVQRSASSR